MACCVLVYDAVLVADWELTEMQRKLWFTSLVAFVQPGTITQVMVALLLTTIFAVMHIVAIPFEVAHGASMLSIGETMPD